MFMFVMCRSAVDICHNAVAVQAGSVLNIQVQLVQVKIFCVGITQKDSKHAGESNEVYIFSLRIKRAFIFTEAAILM